jgi:two-component system, chemotaxis family, sensor kinase CheA
MTESEKLRLIFAPGLSTVETVTDSSGGGVGAGAVWEAVESAGGVVQVRSERGLGTSFVIELPVGRSKRSSLSPLRSAAPLSVG